MNAITIPLAPEGTCLARFRAKVEQAQAMRLITDALFAGYAISVNDGEETTVRKSRNAKELVDAMGTTEADTLTFHATDTVGDGDARCVGSAWLIYGNGRDLISDHTFNDAMHSLLTPISTWAEAIEGACA